MWILLLCFDVYGGGAPATLEFTSQKLCDQAKIEILKEDEKSWPELGLAICVKK